MELLKASDLRKIFDKWSHGTLYNRLESLNIKDNILYTVKNETTGNIQYNEKAIDILKDQYLKEFTNITIEDIDKIIFDFLSSKSNADVSKGNKNNKQKENLKNDRIDTDDNIDNKGLVISLQKQVEILQQQLDYANSTNERLLNTMMFKEQKDAYIEKQKLEQLESRKLLAETQDNQENGEPPKQKQRLFSLG